MLIFFVVKKKFYKTGLLIGNLIWQRHAEKHKVIFYVLSAHVYENIHNEFDSRTAMQSIAYIFFKSVAYSYQGSLTCQLEFCNWLADSSRRDNVISIKLRQVY